jgi:5'-nucleotidase
MESAMSHSLTLHRPLRLRARDEGVFTLDGTPADCIYVALHSGTRVLPRRPDLVVSGVNHGLNLGADVFYSGTVAAAREGALRAIPALACSADAGADPVECANLCAGLAMALLRAPRPSGVAPLLSVNVPPGRGWKVVATRLGTRLYEELVEFRRDPRGREYLWIGGSQVSHPDAPGSDTEAHDRGEVSVTELRLDLSAASDSAVVRALVDASASLSRDPT